MKNSELNQYQMQLIRALAEHDLRGTAVAKEVNYHHNTVFYHVNRIEKQTGLRPTKFYDLVKLLGLTENPEYIAYPERKAIYREAIKNYGEENQLNKFVEELGEFLTELGRIRSGRGDKVKFADELADLTIMLEQLRLIFNVNDEVCARMDYKVRRLEGRLSGKETGVNGK